MAGQKRQLIILVLIAGLIFVACDLFTIAVKELNEENNLEINFSEEIVVEDENEPGPADEESPTDMPLLENVIASKWDLWAIGETRLRGANIWQALVIPEFDGPTFKGSQHVGPPFAQEDFNYLAALGANYVTISGPGIFTEKPPFTVDMEVVENLDNLLEKIANADMFATISFRTGPGRSECTFWCDEEDSDVPDYLWNDTVWQDQAAQNAWVEMWRFTAERYRYNPIVVGYKIMVEPNAAAVFFDIWDPDEFYSRYSDTLYDWNQLHPRIVAGIREIDRDTPVLVNAAGFSAIEWLPALEVLDDPHIVYIVHQYHPYEQYLFQKPGGKNEYPGNIDLDWDGRLDDFNRVWLDKELLSPIDEFLVVNRMPIGVDEFGLHRWVPGGALYMDDLMELFEKRGINYSLWEWSTSWPEFEEEVHAMNFRFGIDSNSRSNADSDLFDLIKEHWSLNTFRPSNVPWK